MIISKAVLYVVMAGVAGYAICGSFRAACIGAAIMFVPIILGFIS